MKIQSVNPSSKASEQSKSQVPVTQLLKLFDVTGTEAGACRGFFLAYVGKDGELILSACANEPFIKNSLISSVKQALNNPMLQVQEEQ